MSQLDPIAWTNGVVNADQTEFARRLQGLLSIIEWAHVTILAMRNDGSRFTGDTRNFSRDILADLAKNQRTLAVIQMSFDRY